MAITESFREAIAANDIMGIRIMMKDSLLVDLTFNEFNDMEKLSRDISGLYDEHDGRELNDDKSSWNDDYMNKLMVQIVGNFSHERVNHLKKVVRHLRPVAAQSQSSRQSRTASSSTQGTSRSSAEKKRYDEQHGRISNHNKQIAAGAIGGGVIGGIIAGAAPVLVGVAVGAIIGGVVVAVVTKGE